MFLVPKEGLTVIDPTLMSPLPPEGRDVGGEQPLYWEMHIRDGSVHVVPEDKLDSAKANALKVQDERRKAEAAQRELDAAKLEEAAAARRATDQQQPEQAAAKTTVKPSAEADDTSKS